jgi:hypothetical protein
MVYGALPLEERNKRSNVHFIGAVASQTGLSAINMVPRLVLDLKMLEKGVLMYSACYGEEVLVVAPLLCITADNPRHSDLCGIYQSSSLFPCRKCYQRSYKHRKPIKRRNAANTSNNPTPSKMPLLTDLIDPQPARTKHHYQEAIVDMKRAVFDILDGKSTYSEFRFKVTGASSLLELDSFDPAADTPVEILHTILVGVAKYLVLHLVQDVIGSKTKQLDRLTAGLRRYKDSTGFSRTFRRKLNHCGSFLGRDFKQLVQCLPIVIAYDFTLDADGDIQAVGILFDALGHLSSLVFVKAVPFNLDMYLSTLQAAVINMTTRLHDYDIQHPQYSPLSTKLKTHILLHLVDDIRRFGCPLHYETEKGEQFNKFIREAIYHTNRQAPSRDLATIFGKRTMLRHIIEGGSWTDINTNNIVKCGSAITAFLNRNNKFLEVFLDGSREFEDNNNVSIDIRPDCYAVFSRVNSSNVKSYFLGKTAKSKTMDVTRYINHGKDSFGYIAASPSRSCYSLVDLKVEGLLDMHWVNGEGNNIVNHNKFGVAWLLANCELD